MKSCMGWVMVGVAAAVLPACTVVQVKPLASAEPVTEVCIVNNPAVQVDDFVSVVQSGFSRHGIATRLLAPGAANECGTTLTYTARRSWDMAPYLSYAELKLWRNGHAIGAAEYRLRRGLFSKGGWALTKWRGTKAKMDPVIDELLKEHATPRAPSATPR